MPRLSRAETQARTRQAILQAAAKVFLEKGFHEATIEAIAEEAGYSSGAVYSNFESKAHLLSSVLARRSQADQAQIAQALSGASSLIEAAKAVGEREGELADEAAKWLLLEWECRIQTLRALGLRRPIDRGQSENVAALGELIGSLLARNGVTTAVLPAQLAAIFTALSNGLAYHRLQFPQDVPRELFASAFALLAAGVEASEPTGTAPNPGMEMQ